jgi:hypothetical protein
MDKYYHSENELQLLLNLTENQYRIAQEQIQYFKSNFIIDNLDENRVYSRSIRYNIDKIMTDAIICVRALRDKLNESG